MNGDSFVVHCSLVLKRYKTSCKYWSEVFVWLLSEYDANMSHNVLLARSVNPTQVYLIVSSVASWGKERS